MICVALFLLASCGATSYAQDISGETRREDPEERAQRLINRMNREEGRVFNTPALHETEPLVEKSEEGRKVQGPLYRVYPPEMVVVAQVEDRTLTRAELDRLIEAREGKLPLDSADEVVARNAELRLRRAEDEVMVEWATRQVMVLTAREQGLRVTAEEVDARMEELSRERLGTSFEEALEGGGSRPVVERDELRRQMAEAMLVDKFLVQNIEKRFPEEALRNIYEESPGDYMRLPEVHAWKIVCRISDEMIEEEIKDRRRDFYKVLKKARKADDVEEFQELAREYSDDEASAADGGDMGWVAPQSAAAAESPILQALAEMEVGEVSDLIRTPAGLHILYVSDKRPGLGLQYDDYARQRVIDHLVVRFTKTAADRRFLRAAPYKVMLNATGLRLTEEGAALVEMRKNRGAEPSRRDR